MTYLASENLLLESDTVLSANAESLIYPVSNLGYGKNQVLDIFRTADGALELNGTDEYAWVLDHNDFDIVGDFTLEGLINITTLDTNGIIVRIYDKSTSIYTAQIDNELRLSLFGSVHSGSKLWTIPAIGWYRFKWAYDVATAVVTLHINGTGETGNLSSSGGLDPGEAIGTNSSRVTIGARSTGTNIFTGKIAYIGIAPAKYDNGAYLDPLTCAGYWSMDSGLDENGKIPDVSGNAHALTVNNIDITNFVNNTAKQWIGFNFSSNQTPQFLFGDRRHNMQDGAEISWYRGDWYSTSTTPELLGTVTIEAGKAFLIRLGSLSTEDTNFFIEMDDPGNPLNHLDIPFLYLGSFDTLINAAGPGYQENDITSIIVVTSNIQTLKRYGKSGARFDLELPFELDSVDLAIWKNARVSALINPVVYYLGGTENVNTAAYEWVNANAFERNVVLQSGRRQSNIVLRELPGGVDQ